uniref:Uncharacterized protein n=1 Tax=Arundo donax TaxID=35708 RepID=A0A0A9BAT1_ARUDO
MAKRSAFSLRLSLIVFVYNQDLIHLEIGNGQFCLHALVSINRSYTSILLKDRIPKSDRVIPARFLQRRMVSLTV